MNKTTQLSRDCAGNGCPNPGVHQLTVIYLNRVGWFCNICKTELIKEGLVLENNGIGLRPRNLRTRTHPKAASIISGVSTPRNDQEVIR